jgi:hypothetical protein
MGTWMPVSQPTFRTPPPEFASQPDQTEDRRSRAASRATPGPRLPPQEIGRQLLRLRPSTKEARRPRRTSGRPAAAEGISGNPSLSRPSYAKVVPDEPIVDRNTPHERCSQQRSASALRTPPSNGVVQWPQPRLNPPPQQLSSRLMPAGRSMAALATPGSTSCAHGRFRGTR